jgi:hypothetical protein
MNIKKVLLPTSIVAVSLAVGCGGKQTPVARVEAAPSVARLPFAQAQRVHLTWTPSAPQPGESPTVFVHLLDDKQKVERTFDHPLPERWKEGTPLEDDFRIYQSALAPPLPAGKYQVTVGLYGKDGKRWALDGLGESVGREEYKAFQIEVPPQTPGPRFAFSANWGPVDPGGDRQVVARRWMASRGAIRLVDQRGPGAVWLMVQIPPTDNPDFQVVLDPGASAPSVLASASCGGGETNFSGPGIHEAELNVDAPPPGGFCRVLLSANFSLQSRGKSAQKRSVSLENISWVPAGGARRPSRTPAAPTGAATPAAAPSGAAAPQ